MKTTQTTSEPNGASPVVRTVIEKALFSREAVRTQRKLRRRIERLEEALRHSVALGQLHPSARLIQANESLRTNFSAARDLLVQLRKSDVHDWETRRIALEESLERLNRSVSAFVLKFDDERRQAVENATSRKSLTAPNQKAKGRS